MGNRRVSAFFSLRQSAESYPLPTIHTKIMALPGGKNENDMKTVRTSERSKNPTIGRALVIWGLLVILAVLNGGFREKVLVPMVGDPAGQILSGFLLCALIMGTTWFLWPRLEVTSWRTVWGIGASWLGMTVAFEFLAGHYLFHKPWEGLFAAYNLSAGFVWIAVLLVTSLAPAVTYSLRGGRAATASR